MEIMSNIQHKKFAMNVRRDGPQPSVFVRSFSAITTSSKPSVCPHLRWVPIIREVSCQGVSSVADFVSADSLDDLSFVLCA